MAKEIDLKDLTDINRLREILNHIKEGSDQYILKDNGQPLAALLSLDDLELIKKAKEDKEKALENLFKNLKEVHARNADASEEQVHKDVEEAIREIRRSRNKTA